MPTPNITDVPQYPMRSGGQLGQYAVWAIGKIHIATGGMPGTGRITASGGLQTGVPAVYGMPGFSATFVGSGTYDIRFPATQIVSVIPQVSAPSGQFFAANVLKAPSGSTASGIMTLQVARSANASGFATQVLPSGARIDMHFLLTPSNDQGLTQF